MTDGELDNLERTSRNLMGLDNIDVSLLELDPERIADFRAALVRLKDSGTRKLVPVIKDIDRWTEIADGSLNSGDIHPKTLEQFAELAGESR